jgi:chromosome segregation ATPase
MNAVNNVDKELKEIPYELTKMRAKKQEIQGEINNLNREKDSLFYENFKVKKDIASLSVTLKALKAEVAGEENKKRGILSEIESEHVNLNNRKALLNNQQEQNELLAKKNADQLSEIKKQDSALKEKIAKIGTDNAEISRKIAAIAKRESDAEKMLELADEKIKEANDKLHAASKKESHAEASSNEAIAIKQEYANKIQETKETKSVLEDIIKQYKKKESIIANELSVKVEELKSELREKTERVENKERSFDAMIAENKNEKKRLEILDLKLQKLAREKGLEDELKELKKEMA